MKNMLSMNPSFSIPARSSELTKYFKGSGTWWMRNYYFNTRSHKQIPLHVLPTLVGAKRCSSTQLSCKGKQSDEVKSPNIPHNNVGIPAYTQKHKNRRAVELNGLCLKCFVRATVQCAWFAPQSPAESVSGLILYVIHYIRWQRIYNQSGIVCKFKHFIATVKKNSSKLWLRFTAKMK